MKDQLPGSVKFIFQPAEESPADFGTQRQQYVGRQADGRRRRARQPQGRRHLRPARQQRPRIRQARLAQRPSMAAADQFWIDVKGRQTHGARPGPASTPSSSPPRLCSACRPSKPPPVNAMLEPSVITVGTIHGGNRMNIVPEKVEMMGTIRTYDEGMKKDIHARMKRTTEAIASSSRRRSHLQVVELYNATVNQPALTEKMAPTLVRVAGDGNWMIVPKATASEDFSFYQERYRACSFNPGVTPMVRTRQGRVQPLAGVLCG